MKRTIQKDLETWASSPIRKPLVLNGARQVGKTYSLKEFGKTHFQNFHLFNFDLDGSLCSVFRRTKNPSDILKFLEAKSGKKISPKTDLLFFDEIQVCSEALSSLKYFSEDFPEYNVCAAGSLLGLNLGSSSFPVGKIEILNMYPLSFLEFAQNSGYGEKLLHTIDQLHSNLILDKDFKTEIDFHEELWKLFKTYLIIGGLPEVCLSYFTSQSFEKVRVLQSTLISGYLADVTKHSGKVNGMHIGRILEAVPNQMLADVDFQLPRFQFLGIVPGVKGFDRLAPAIDWLVQSGLVYKIPISNSGLQPAQVFTKQNMFKLALFDTGLLGALSGMNPSLLYDYQFGTYKGYFAENFVLQQLTAAKIKGICCWREGTAEVEFLLPSSSGNSIPVEVKSGNRTKLKSLSVYMQKYSPKNALVFCGKSEVSLNNSILKLPLYLAGFVDIQGSYF